MLRCLRPYRHAGLGLVCAPGDLITRDADIEAWLLRDAPGCFAVVAPDPDSDPDPAAAALTGPPAHRMVDVTTPRVRRRRAGPDADAGADGAGDAARGEDA